MYTKEDFKEGQIVYIWDNSRCIWKEQVVKKVGRKIITFEDPWHRFNLESQIIEEKYYGWTGCLQSYLYLSKEEKDEEDRIQSQLKYIRSNVHNCSAKLIDQIVEQIKAELK